MERGSVENLTVSSPAYRIAGKLDGDPGKFGQCAVLSVIDGGWTIAKRTLCGAACGFTRVVLYQLKGRRGGSGVEDGNRFGRVAEPCATRDVQLQPVKTCKNKCM